MLSLKNRMNHLLKALNKNIYFHALLMAFIVLLVLLTFQPFGVKVKNIRDLYFILGFGFICFISLVISEKLKAFVRSKSKVLIKAYPDFFLPILFISILNYLYISTVQRLEISFVDILVKTFIIGVLPITVDIIITLKTMLYKSAEIQDEETSIYIFGDRNKQLKLDKKRLSYIQSTGNYLKIYSLNEQKLTYEIHRATFQKNEAHLLKDGLIRIHRSFMVNVSYIKNLKSSSNGYYLELKINSIRLPVSRKYIKEVQMHLEHGRIYNNAASYLI